MVEVINWRSFILLSLSKCLVLCMFMPAAQSTVVCSGDYQAWYRHEPLPGHW